MNGTIKSIRDIVHNLNNAKLDPNTGILYPILHHEYAQSSH